MKICLISFDYWGFDQHIIDALQKRGIEASHINLNDFTYSYPNIISRVGNSLSKIILDKIIKNINNLNQRKIIYITSARKNK